MSQSKPPRAKAQAKAKAKSPAARKTAETIRIIPAASAAPKSDLPMSELSRRVIDAAAAVEHAVKQGDDNAALHPEAVQAMLAALCKVYSAHVEAGEHYDAFSQTNPVTPTDVMVTASGLLKAANLAVFELGMWQSWTGR
jgi:hypothetical protein